MNLNRLNFLKRKKNKTFERSEKAVKIRRCSSVFEPRVIAASGSNEPAGV